MLNLAIFVIAGAFSGCTIPLALGMKRPKELLQGLVAGAIVGVILGVLYS